MASSINTHKAVYTNILNADTPTAMDKLVDRNIVPYCGDAAVNLAKHIMASSGISTVFVPDDHVDYHQQP